MAEKQCNLLKNGGGMIKYSTTEQKVGKWIDGKDAYQITVTGSATTSSDVKVELLSGVDSYIKSEGTVEVGGYVRALVVSPIDPNTGAVWWTTSVELEKSTHKISFVLTSHAGSMTLGFTVTLLYTKL